MTIKCQKIFFQIISILFHIQLQELMSFYNSYRIPSTYSTAYDHQQAIKPGAQLSHEFFCPCCLLPINDTPLPINFQMKKIEIFGKEYAYFFQLCKVILIALLILAFDSGIPALQDSYMITDGVILPIGNHQIMISPLQPGFSGFKFTILSILSFVTLLGILVVIRIFIKVKLCSDEKGEQKWSILLKNIPKTASPRQKIQNLFDTNFDGVQIKQIILISKFQKHCQIQEQINQKINQWKQILANKQRNKDDVLVCLRNIEEQVAKLTQWKQQCQLNDEGEQFSGNAIVIFHNSDHAEEVLKTPFLTKNKIQASFGQIAFGEKELMEISACPNPQETIWENISLPIAEKRGKSKIAYIYLGLICGVFMLIYFLTQLIFGRNVGDQDDIDINRPASILGLSILSLMHLLLLPYLIKKVQKQQKYDSETQSQVGFMIKYSCFTIFFRVVILLSVESIFYSGTTIPLAAVNKITIMFFIDLFLGSIVCILNPLYLVKKIKEKIFSDRNKQTQKEANQLFECPSFNVGYKYSLALNMFWFTTILGNIVPIATIIMPLTILIWYWSCKLNLSRRESLDRCKINVQYLLRKCLECMQLSLILKPSVNMLLWGLANEQMAYAQIFMFIGGMGFIFLNKDKLVQKILSLLDFSIGDIGVQKMSPQQEQKHKYHNQGLMNSTYYLWYPITSDVQKKKKFMEQKIGRIILFRSQVSEENNEQIGTEVFHNVIESERKMSEKGSSD